MPLWTRVRALRPAPVVLAAIALSCPACAPRAAQAAAAAGGPVPSFAPTGGGSQYAAASDGAATPLPSLQAHFLDGRTITVDGRLDDPAWEDAQTAWGFQQHEPARGGPPSVPTTFKVAYDRHALYVGVACWERDMSLVSSYLSRRGAIEASDLVSVYLDPYLDRKTGYNFRVNPQGVMQDDYLFDDGSRDGDWNAVWEAQVTSDERGWYVEMRIPFAAVRFKPAPDMTWGLQVYRWMHGRGEDTGWVTWDRMASGFVSRFGTLTGLRDVDSPRQLEILPYAATKHADPAAPAADDGWRSTWNLGADLKYGPTADLTLNATFQPDFGQVEADPSVLNLSPFEIQYDEKRPFFIEGAPSFQNPEFNLFYSRRIGTGDPNARIRGAAKLTGKLGGGYSLALLGAATDVGVPDKVHNPFAGGDRRTYFGVARVGREFAAGNHQVFLMGTAVRRDSDSFAAVADPRLLRDAYSAGLDFQLNFRDRTYRIMGTAVGTVLDPFADLLPAGAPAGRVYGTGGHVELSKIGGAWRGSLAGRWESDRFDPNDLGYLAAPDEQTLGAELEYLWNGEGADRAFQWVQVEAEAYRTWYYAGDAGRDPDTGQEIWSYRGGHPQAAAAEVLVSARHRNYHEGWVYAVHYPDLSDKYETRRANPDDPYDPASPRGPLITLPGWTNLAAGVSTDWRKPLSAELSLHWDGGDNLQALAVEGGLKWNQSQHFSHGLTFTVRHNRSDAQWIDNFADDGTRPGVAGIGGIDYVFAELDQMIWDLTLRSSALLDRDRSLQLYAQPFLTRGRFRDPVYLATPDSYDVRPYDLDAGAYDFNFGAVNLNLVYRWEFRPGSAIFLVWTHTKERYEQRRFAADPAAWRNGFDAGYPFAVEPGNTLLAKVSWWFSL